MAGCLAIKLHDCRGISIVPKQSSAIKEHFSELTDPRRREVRYPLINVVTIALCAVVCGADDFVASPTQAVPIGFYATSRHCIPRRSPRNSNSAKRLTMALQRTAPRVTVAAILTRASLVLATFFRSSYALSSFHPRSYRAALRSL